MAALEKIFRELSDGSAISFGKIERKRVGIPLPKCVKNPPIEEGRVYDRVLLACSPVKNEEMVKNEHVGFPVLLM